LLNASESNPSLHDIAMQYGSLAVASDDNIYGKGAKRELPETAVLSEHVARKATAIWQIVPTIKAELAANQMEKLLDDLEGPTSLVLAKMERLGVKVEGDRLNQMGQDL
ncbi:hypothetical protein MXD63_42435, partial [Frankia sp. Cpl3]|nr:hypothetical protein [Frankia sp. Cpl3]